MKEDTKTTEQPGETLLSENSSQHESALSPESTPAPFSWAAEDGTFTKGWMEHLPSELRGNPSLATVGSLPDLAKNYVATKALVGRKLEMPGENASPEQIANWRRTVGAPEKPEGYLGQEKSLRPAEVPESLWNGEGEKQFLAVAHKHHLSPAAVKDIMAYYGQSLATSVTAAQQEEGRFLEAEGHKLRAAWGADYDANLHTASRVAQTMGLDPKSHPIFTSAEVVQAFARLGRLFSEDKLVRGESPSAGGVPERIREISDPHSSSQLARAYRGELGADAQQQAQRQLHQLIAMNH